jgi:hypothetical protein
MFLKSCDLAVEGYGLRHCFPLRMRDAARLASDARGERQTSPLDFGNTLTSAWAAAKSSVRGVRCCKKGAAGRVVHGASLFWVRGGSQVAMTDPDRVKLQIAAVIEAVPGRYWLRDWKAVARHAYLPLIGAVVAATEVYRYRAFRQCCNASSPSITNPHRGLLCHE